MFCGKLGYIKQNYALWSLYAGKEDKKCEYNYAVREKDKGSNVSTEKIFQVSSAREKLFPAGVQR